MANALAWLLGREDRTGEPPPVSVAGPELRSYDPSPSERFGNWISDALGAGPGASLAHQNFAKGVPSVLSLFPPLGVGLSAADLLHAKAAGDPMGAAAAAIGMVPGAGGEAGTLAKKAYYKVVSGEMGLSKIINNKTGEVVAQHLWPDEASAKLKELQSSFIPPKPVAIPGTNPALAKGGDPNAALAALEEVLGKQAPFPSVENLASLSEIFKKPAAPTASYVKFDPHVGDYTVFDKSHKPVESFPTEDKAQKFAAKWDASFGQGPTNTQAAAAPQVVSQTSGFTKHPNYEWAQLKNGGYEIYDNKTASTVAHVNTLEEAANYKGPAAATPKPIFDYEKDDTGLYHIFDATSGKTHAVVDKESQAKAWINEQKAAGMGMKQQTIPITESPSIPWKAKDYSNSQVFGDLGIFPQEAPFKLPEKAIAQGYVTPAVHGTMSQEWSTPTKAGIGEVGDALRLPSDELGVHFGTPDQARQFTGREINEQVLPRTYPTALQTGKSLELPDMGTWHVSDIKKALRQLDTGIASNMKNFHSFPMTNVEQHTGKFPREELNDIFTIEEMRKYLREKGYNSVNYINAVEGPGQRSHIMFNPSPESPNYVAGVRSPFAAFDPSKMMRPELGLSIMGMLGLGAAAAPTKSEAKGASK